MAGGIGINLYSANRVIIFDVSWNPGRLNRYSKIKKNPFSHSFQHMIFKQCFVRIDLDRRNLFISIVNFELKSSENETLVISGIIGKSTMEEKIYKRQITKQAMSQRVVDAKQLDRHFTNDELAQLYRFEPDIENDPLDKYDAERVKDKILRKLMDEYEQLIVSYREHDSLLVHRDEENLTEEEQKQAQHEGSQFF